MKQLFFGIGILTLSFVVALAGCGGGGGGRRTVIEEACVTQDSLLSAHRGHREETPDFTGVLGPPAMPFGFLL